MQEKAVTKSFQVPIIDLASSDSGHVQTQIREGLSETGFLVLVNHGIERQMLHDVLKFAEEFFAQSTEEKQALLWSDPSENTGYVSIGQEGLSEDGLGDPKEALDLDPNFIESALNSTLMMDYWEKISDLNQRLLRLISLSLGLSENALTEIHQEDWNTLRLLHYPSTADGQSRLRAGGHSDYGSLTFLIQDSIGGLELLDRISQNWVPLHPIDGAIAVNCGDLLMMLTNNLFPSTMHRVVAATSTRYSSAFFTNPDPDVVIDATHFFPSQDRVYKPIEARQYLFDRLSATYEDFTALKTEL